MSAGYNSGLSEYPNKGKLNLKEVEDGLEEIKTKIDQLAQLILESKRTVVHTGAGISTSCGIPDFRGPKVVIKSPLRVPYKEQNFDHDFWECGPGRLKVKKSKRE